MTVIAAASDSASKTHGLLLQGSRTARRHGDLRGRRRSHQTAGRARSLQPVRAGMLSDEFAIVGVDHGGRTTRVGSRGWMRCCAALRVARRATAFDQGTLSDYSWIWGDDCHGQDSDCAPSLVNQEPNDLLFKFRQTGHGRGQDLVVRE